MQKEINRNIHLAGDSRSLRRSFLPCAQVSADDSFSSSSDFDNVLFWARLAASQSRKPAHRISEEARALREFSDQEVFLAQFVDWRKSKVFSAREKAAIDLSESISKTGSKKSLRNILKRAALHFDTSEIIQLTLAIRAINDWYDAHSRSITYILVVQSNPEERANLQALISDKARKSKTECFPLFTQDTQEALSLLTSSGPQLFLSRLIGVVIDVCLPHIDSTQLLNHIRQIPGADHLPVAVMTTSLKQKDLEECEQLKRATGDEVVANFASIPEVLNKIIDHGADGNCPTFERRGRAEVPVPKLANVSKRLREYFSV